MREKRGTKHLSNGERRAKIIDAALSVFAKNGFKGSRIKEIAEQAGISEALIYQHFKNKEDLYRTAIGELLDLHPMGPEVEEMMANKDDYGVFSTFALHMFRFSRQDPRIVRLVLFSALEGSPVISAFRPHKEQHIGEILVGYIQQRIEEGAFRKVNAQLAGQLFMEAIFMSIVDQEASVTTPLLPFSDEETADTLVKMCFDGLKADAIMGLPVKADIVRAVRPD